jgi:predicted transcriptional regulator
VNTTKAMTLRLDADLAEELKIVAEVDQQPIAEVVRMAVTNYISNRNDRITAETYDRREPT